MSSQQKLISSSKQIKFNKLEKGHLKIYLQKRNKIKKFKHFIKIYKKKIYIEKKKFAKVSTNNF